jgi:hypothetical protein
MRSTLKQTAFLALLLGALAAPQAARASEKEEARKHYDRAIELVDDGQLEGAMVEFQRSYDLTHHFAVLYNIGQVFVSLAKPVEAVDAYERYLIDGGKKIPAARRTEVEQEIARQKARIATLQIRGLPEGAGVRVDGKEIGKAPIAAHVRVGVGTHVIAASAEGYEPTETQVTVAGEDQKVVELVLAKHVVEAPPAPVVAVPAAPLLPVEPLASAVSAPVISTTVEPPIKQQSVSNTRIVGIVSGAVGVAGIAAGTVCWFAAKSRHNDAVTNWNQYSDNKAQQLQSDAQDYTTAANVSFIAGGVLAALGVVLYFVGARDGQAVTPDTHVHLTPAVGPGFAGINAGGIW